MSPRDYSMSQLCSICHAFPVTLHTPGACSDTVAPGLVIWLTMSIKALAFTCYPTRVCVIELWIHRMLSTPSNWFSFENSPHTFVILSSSINFLIFQCILSSVKVNWNVYDRYPVHCIIYAGLSLFFNSSIHLCIGQCLGIVLIEVTLPRLFMLDCCPCILLSLEKSYEDTMIRFDWICLTTTHVLQDISRPTQVNMS